MGDKTNFSTANSYTRADFAPGAQGSFIYSGSTTFTDELIPVDVTKTYELSLWAKAVTTGSEYAYLGFVPYDIDGVQINAYNYLANTGSVDTVLTSDLNPGDTTVSLANTSGWHNGTTPTSRCFAWGGWKSSLGYSYADYTYTRYSSSPYYATDTWPQGGISGNTITLTSPWPVAAGKVLAGTAASNYIRGAAYRYTLASLAPIPTSWTQYSSPLGGASRTVAGYTFPSGTAFIKLMIWPNATGSTAGSSLMISGARLIETLDREYLFSTASATNIPTLPNANILMLCTGATSYNVTLPPCSTVRAGNRVTIKSVSAGTVTAVPSSGDTIDGATSAALTQYQRLTVVNDGTRWRVL